MLEKWNKGEMGDVGYVRPKLGEQLSNAKVGKDGRLISGVWKISWDWAVRKWADGDRKKATEAEVAAYELAHGGMVAHEDEHVAIDKRLYATENVADQAGMEEKAAYEALDALTDRGNQANADFDSETEHGVSPPAGKGESTHMRGPSR
jgi:hypothetical protein